MSDTKKYLVGMFDDDDVLFSNMDNMPSPTTSFWSKERIRKL
jgi:hypothetical protein